MTNEITGLFKEICKPFENGIGGEKVTVMENWLTSKNIKNKYVEGIGLIANNEIPNPRLILVSHLDLITTFTKGFESGKTFEIKDDMVIGALDNTITNACAMLAIAECIDFKDILVIFTEGEEIGGVGIRRFLQEFPKVSESAFFINLDVTNDGWDTDISVEYDRPNFDILKDVEGQLTEFNAHIQGTRFFDDMTPIVSAGYAGFSYCIPTKGMIHSYSNYCKLSSIEPYYRGLVKLIKYIGHDYWNYELFNGYDMPIALASKTEEEFKANI